MKFRSLVLYLALIAAGIACRGVVNAASPCDVYSLSTMHKLREGENPSGRPAHVIQLHAARGEGESANLVLRANKDLKDVRIGASKLSGPRGFTFAPEVNLVDCIPVTNPSPGGYGTKGSFPDPLVPIKPFDLPAEKSRGIWLTAWVPENAPAGLYRGTLSVSPRGESTKSVPIKLRVYNVRIPKQSALKTCFLVWDVGEKPEHYGSAWTPEMSRRFHEKALRYRMSTTPPLPWKDVFVKDGCGKWWARWEKFDSEVRHWFDRGVTFFSVGASSGMFPFYGGGGGPISYQVDPTDPAETAARTDRQAKLKLLNDHLVEKGWTGRFAFYIYDEPIISPDYPNKGDTAGPDNVGKVKALADFVRGAAPNLRTLFITTDPLYEAVACDYPAYCWVPHINHFHPDFQRRRQKMGEESWMYQCVTTLWVPEYPDIWRLDRTGTSHRVTGWWLWKYRCEGFLYWCIDYWVQDPWKNAAFVPGFPTGNGEGVFFYPDPEKKALPFASVRAEIIRDSFEDYDLLFLLKKRADSTKSDPQAKTPLKQRAASAEKLLNVDDIVSGIDKFSTDPALYESKHRKLLEALEGLGG